MSTTRSGAGAGKPALSSAPDDLHVEVRKVSHFDWEARITDGLDTYRGYGLTKRGAIRSAYNKMKRRKLKWERV